VCGVGYGGYRLYRSSLFELDHISVEGNAAISRQEVIAASGLEGGENVLSLPLDRARRRLEAHPWVARAKVSRMPPSGILITIRERAPLVALAQSQGVVLVAGDGVVLGPQADRGRLPEVLVGGLPVEKVTAGDRVNGNLAVANALAVVAGLDPEVARQVVGVDARGVDGLELVLASGVRVRYGSADEQERKDRAILLMLSRAASEGTALDYLDVRAPGAPVLRPKSA